MVTVYPRPQVLTNPQMAAAEGEPDAVGRELMIGCGQTDKAVVRFSCVMHPGAIAVTVVRGFCVAASRAMRELLAVISL